MLVTLSDVFTENINITNYSIGIIILVVIFSILDIIINNVQSLIDQKRGRNIKIFIYFIEILFGLITITISLIKGFSKNTKDNLILIVNEEDIYIRHLSASMIRRVKELSKTYLIFITTIFISTIIDVYMIFIYNSENFYNYIYAKEKFNFDDFFSFIILFFIKDLLPYLIIVIATLIYRWK
jgi:small-conductance mechanosensitive channel